MIHPNVRIIVENGNLAKQFVDRYVEHLLRTCKRKDFTYIKFSLHDNSIDIHYAFKGLPFERIWNVERPETADAKNIAL